MIPLAYSVVVSSGLCYALITWANKQTSPTIVTAFWPVQVPCTVILSYFIFHQELGWRDYLGGCLIILGLLLVCWAKRNLEKEQEQLTQYSRINEETDEKPDF